MKRRIIISITLMLLAIVAIVAFQSYWIYKTFGEEHTNLALRTNVLFRDAVNQCQLQNLRLDSNLRIRISAGRPAGPDPLNIILKKRIGDGEPVSPGHSTVMVTTNRKDIHFIKNKPDTTTDVTASFRYFTGDPKIKLIQVLRGVDSLQDSISIKTLSARYRQLLQREKIPLAFDITRSAGVPHDEFFLDEPVSTNEITLGFTHPVTYRLNLHNTTAYILRKTTPQVLVSLLLVTLTICSFFLLLRNLIRQRKLTELKNDFISNITHELKTPIATVSVAVEAMASFNALQDPARTREYLEISSHELQRLSLLVDKVLKLSMFEKQEIELKEEWLDLTTLVDEVVASMRLQFEKYKAQVSTDVTGTDFMMKGDRMHLVSVIFNLFDNALKYSKANPSIQVQLHKDAHCMSMSVTDNGIGILPEYRRKIFDKFFRVPMGNTHNVKGYGLGLSYVAYVVQRHQGTIEVESQPGIGSRFLIKFPATA